MAYAKTSLIQISAQVGIGVGVGLLCWNSFIRDRSDDSAGIIPHPCNIEALEAEVRENTTGKAWRFQNPEQKPTVEKHPTAYSR